MKVDKSLYQATKRRSDLFNNVGYDYRDKILLNTMDANILKNVNILGFAKKLETIINQWIYECKAIKKFNNFFVDKDEDVRIL